MFSLLFLWVGFPIIRGGGRVGRLPQSVGVVVELQFMGRMVVFVMTVVAQMIMVVDVWGGSVNMIMDMFMDMLVIVFVRVIMAVAHAVVGMFVGMRMTVIMGVEMSVLVSSFHVSSSLPIHRAFKVLLEPIKMNFNSAEEDVKGVS